MQANTIPALSLSDAAKRIARDHPQWQLTPCPVPAIRRSWEFADFCEAFAFMTRVALLAEQQGHHPEWTNVYRWVDIRLTTHDAGGLSEKDFRLARSLDLLVPVPSDTGEDDAQRAVTEPSAGAAPADMGPTIGATSGNT